MTDPRNLPVALPVVRVGEIPEEESPRRWMIEGLWGASAVGLVGGAPKCCKSWLGLDMAVSVATATSCLERYEILEPGPALVYLAEDALLTVRERVAGIARRRGLELRDLDLHVITAPTLRLDRAEDREQLFEAVRRLRARLLLLDPLVRLHSADENNATEMAQLLFYLRDLQRQLDLSVVLVHHTRKHVPSGAQAGQGLRGSSDLHAFGDSNLYLRRTRDGLLLSMEHRAAAAPEPVALQLVAADSSSIHLEVTALAPAPQAECKARLEDAILLALEETSAMTRGRLRDRLSVNNERLGEVLAQLERDGKIARGPDGWRHAAG
jgi:hypothetical protein